LSKIDQAVQDLSQNEIFDFAQSLVLTFDLGVSVMKKIPPTLCICIYGPNLNKIGSVISEKIEFFPPPNNNNNKKNNINYRNCSPL